MGLDLQSESGKEMRFNGTAWCLCLNLAEAYGWIPLGTEPPEDYDLSNPWHGEYDLSDGQKVNAEDSKALADALQRALKSSDFAAIYSKIYAGMNQVVLNETGLSRDVEPLSEAFLKYIRDFIEFCKLGAFIIW